MGKDDVVLRVGCRIGKVVEPVCAAVCVDAFGVAFTVGGCCFLRPVNVNSVVVEVFFRGAVGPGMPADEDGF